jgi:GNAT superfamily N-acetyltransferase
MEVNIDKLIPSDAAAGEEILGSLPKWFGIETSIQSYRRDIENMPTDVARYNDEIVGFVTTKRHNEQSAAIPVIGVRKEYHSMWIGRCLVSHTEAKSRQTGVKYLQVKTLEPSQPSEHYLKPRRFYEANGVSPIEETNSIWGEESPCLIIVRGLRGL